MYVTPFLNAKDQEDYEEQLLITPILIQTILFYFNCQVIRLPRESSSV